jgi:hypothetical protein
MAQATGTFDVKMAQQKADSPQAQSPQTPSTPAQPAALSRWSIDKQFHGALEATSTGEMLAAGNPGQGNAGYVAMESVSGTLDGHTGSFVLQHTGTMDHGALSLTVTVVPGSGTGELTGLKGSMSITVESGKHSYTFGYSLPPN